MDTSTKRWMVYDRDSNPVYLTDERWQHIVDQDNHPEIQEFEEYLKNTIRLGHRRQEPLNPRKYRYSQVFNDLPDDFTHIVAIVLFGFDVNEDGETIPNNFVATAFMKHSFIQGGNP